MTSNFNDRKAQILVVHGTEVDDSESRRILSGAAGIEASSHYYIDDKGAVTQYVDETKRAWHTGRSYWSGMTDINSISIGVELLAISKNRTFDGKETFYTQPQIDSFIKLAKEIIDRNKIKSHLVLGHQDIAATVERTLEPMVFETVEQLYASGRNVGLERKYDPGPSFPWKQLAEQGVGVWHDMVPQTEDAVLTSEQDIEQTMQLLGMYGYDIRSASDRTTLLKAFQTHFLPWNICGQVTQQTLQAAKILVENKYK